MLFFLIFFTNVLQNDTPSAMAKRLNQSYIHKRLEETQKERQKRTHCLAIYRDKVILNSRIQYTVYFCNIPSTMKVEYSINTNKSCLLRIIWCYQVDLRAL